mgnify:CR=1 FL=1
MAKRKAHKGRIHIFNIIPIAMKKLLTFLLVSFLSFSLMQAQSVVGDWNGSIQVSGMNLRIGLSLIEQDTGLAGTLDILDQGIYGIKLQNPNFKDNKLSFTSTMQVDYTGTWQEGDSLEGTLVIRKDQEYPLVFKRGKIVLNRPQEPKAPFPYRIEDVTYDNPNANGVTLAGTITIPQGEGPFPVAVLISGSGPNNRDEEILTHKPFAVIADQLSRNGIAVLRYDDRGCAKSTGSFGKATGEDFASDASAGVDYLVSRKDLPLGKIGLIGHSEGGELAPQVAHDNSKVDFIILLAGPGMQGVDVLTEQTRLIMLSNGNSQEESENAATFNSKLYRIAMKKGKSKKVKKKVLKAYEKEIKRQEKAGESTDEDVSPAAIKQQATMLSGRWFRHFLRYDSRVFLRQTTIPVLALNGEEDIQVASKSNLAGIKEALDQAGNTQYKIQAFPKLNHLFQHCNACTFAEYAELEETFSPEVLEVMIDWISGLAE